ncbi:50S ribosomal protein L23 [Acidithiobacillus sp. CV18-2]|uniref:Large ribosomal subunit protein uL23 n=1 Tax=Igneacidithiobacillus copahuensis TaxID=2724909 RepID=A0AAE2YMP1_9PROT|nr:50S ribosomal protein L23 [Igneacidithiobacillus copahuensis]MBU2754018.1 50S ribosomal protein L23 [Acidithiobacillus sp. CV18-3]MBU2756246.1 50S ribosomal protein L23 [Acidithiobacillus sp. BN09-2]MBU2778691.1 50S ribosomal protein L23 [Acidithiobacillus sp. CV18-2]MBU2797258.1 50S ribosomal protein L23 [Acidithiobacillus sp. VAN18-2]MBU2798853.1 50S ribosomal protein L23 [Acidithiobacillus sp. VAN18-4]UTV81394.1 50S ribosomal protein L23 [Acidithiobacillus sp. YTS05]
MNNERQFLVLLAPIVSEKSTMQTQAANQYAFRVARDATKSEIKSAVERLFQVNVLSVQTLNYAGKAKRMGRHAGRRSSWKKAYVRLAEGNSIDLGIA